ncbi:DNA-binding protein WhiA [Savagea sp. SN6]|uniref:Probable cell division protein WhiA n=1 Tax=Savagea serpentis TaxID=2785297 RepID=A0A8J7KCA5_9BACL|nr:DNA-binding protein WhiA [Savagea serpentis]MBF4501232.1 DNA-binding protein WhiA [Savagea serpentis]
MSFASKTKKELTQIEADECCLKAETAAFIRMNGVLSLSNKQLSLDIQTENAAIARRMYSNLKALYQVEVELLVRRKMRLKKNNVYICRIRKDAKKILEQLSILKEGFQFQNEIDPKLIQDDCCKRSYLRGAFLAGGSVNNPETSSYHLEIFSVYEEQSKALVDLMNLYDLNAKSIERKKGYIAYLKEAEKISDFLGIVGAYVALMKFEDVRIIRDVRNSVNRLVNCETANLNKTISAAQRQVENIKLIERTIGIDELPERLQEVARLRVEHQDVTLKELGEMISGGPVSKSGINHRLRKIEEIANNLKEHESVR